MSHRTFVDSDGNEWQAFDVVPRSDERRNYDRRNSADPEAEPDQRHDADRRLTVGGSGNLLRGAQGWLVFERESERRRLSPIPQNWSRASDAELDAYRREARPVRNSTEVPVVTDEAR
jgi:hypothetical protein